MSTSKLPKVNYKKQLKSEMIKSFNRFFSSSSEQLETTNLKIPGEETIYDLKKHMEELSQTTSNGQDKDGFDHEFDALTKVENALQRESNFFKTARLSKNSKKNKFSKILPSKFFKNFKN